MGPADQAGSGRAARWPEAVAVAALVLAACYPLGNVDLFGHMAAGREIVELGHVPTHDSASLFRDEPQPWRNHNWLSGLITFWLYEHGAASSLMALKLALAGLMALFVVARARELAPRWGPGLAAVLVVAAVPASRFRFSMRPHLFGLCLGALGLFGLSRLSSATARGSRVAWLAALFAIQIAWTNLHGSSLLAPVLTGAYLLPQLREPQARWIAGALGLQLLGSCITPFGAGLLLEALAHVGSSAASDSFSEWRPLGPGDPLTLMASAMFFVLLALVAVRPLWSGDARSRGELLMTLLLCLLAVRAVRFVPWLALLATPALAAGLSPLLARVRRPAATLTVALVATSLLGGMAAAQLPPNRGPGLGFDMRGLPVAAGQWLARHYPRARLGGVLEDLWYLSFAAPRTRVLIDGRLALYGPDHYRKVAAALTRAHAFRALIDHYRIDAVVLQHTLAEHQTALGALTGSPAWHAVVVEDHHVLFLRDLASTRELLAHHELQALHPSYALSAAATARTQPSFGAELARMEALPGTGTYVAWLRGVDALAGALRAQGLGGIAPPASEASRAAHERALKALRRADAGVGQVVPVQTTHGVVAAQLCHLDEAQDALERARAPGESRESLLLAQELSLARGDAASVAGFVEQARALPAGRDDPWLANLAERARDPHPCP